MAEPFNDEELEKLSVSDVGSDKDTICIVRVYKRLRATITTNRQWIDLIEKQRDGIQRKLDNAKRRLTRERELSETRRALLEKYQWVYQPTSAGSVVSACLECGAVKETGQDSHNPDCAIATALKGVGE